MAAACSEVHWAARVDRWRGSAVGARNNYVQWLQLQRCSAACGTDSPHRHYTSVIFVNENENENGEKRENNEFVNEN